MNEKEMLSRIMQIVGVNYIRIYNLLAGMGIPRAALTRTTWFKLCLDGDDRFDFVFQEGALSTHVSDKRKLEHKDLTMSAGYNRGEKMPAIFVNSKPLEEEAKAIGISMDALLEILVMHELVHCIMQSGFTDCPWIPKAGDPMIYIHEACALYACEHGFIRENLYKTASADDVKRYIGYMGTSNGSDSEYAPYFTTCRNLPLSDLWPQLEASSPCQLDFKAWRNPVTYIPRT